MVFAFVVTAIAALTFFGGYSLGYASVSKDMQLRTTTAETTASNCLKKLTGWCDNNRFRLVDCGDNLQVCVCMSQREVKSLRHDNKFQEK